ncbi:hypothetical protein HY488_00680 [Candidatus Woesearchaeota archaeon]|nr:hypothetical protein [Candidatus Woesearchaeota archaeon]
MVNYGYFQNAVAQLDALGITDVLLPFFLIFTIVFAILQRTKLLGENRKNFNVMIALILAFAVVIPHVTGGYPPGMDVVDIINRALPNVSLVLVAILMVLILIGLFGWSVGGEGTSIQGWIAFLAFLAVVYIFGAAADLWHIPNRLNFLLNPDTQALIVVLLIFGIVVWFITKEEKESAGEGALKSLGKTLGELFKKH